MQNCHWFLLFIVAFSLAAVQRGLAKEGVIRAGIVGCDTSHVEAFTKLINNPDAAAPFDGVEVIAAFPGGSPDMKKESMDRVPGYVKKLKGMGVKIVDSIDEIANECDAIMIESVDGRPHLKQFEAVAKGKPVFIDKPAAGSLADLFKILKVAGLTKTPVYSSSALRFGKEVQAVRNDKSIGEFLGCETVSPMSMEKHHPDLFWYGIHGVEPLFTIMHAGCDTVARTDTEYSTVVVGKWKDGRIGSYRGVKQGHYYALSAFYSNGVKQRAGFEGYEPAVAQMCEFFKTRIPPVTRQEMIEIYAFMEAADESKKNGGAPVKISEIIERAEKAAAVASTSAAGDK
jgi:hypothetical protein